MQIGLTSATSWRLAIAAMAILLWGGAATAAQPTADTGEREVAVFAGGCFWCVESDFDRVPGVIRTVSGFTGGRVANPSYKQVVEGDTGHREAVQIVFDPGVVSYRELVDIFWRTVDPTDAGGQFCDRGFSYTTAIYALDATQAAEAKASRDALVAEGTLQAPVVTPVESAAPFFPAEDYHQDYYDKNPIRYRIYRAGCGRNGRVEALWGEQAYRGLGDH
jgi:peptide-methionine (S)-S-oxide reductase